MRLFLFSSLEEGHLAAKKVATSLGPKPAGMNESWQTQSPGMNRFREMDIGEAGGNGVGSAGAGRFGGAGGGREGVRSAGGGGAVLRVRQVRGASVGRGSR